MGASRSVYALSFAMLLMFAGLGGCFGNENDVQKPLADSITVMPSSFTGGILQVVSIQAKEDVSVFVPYLFKQSDSGLFQNGTIVDIDSGEVVELEILIPPRTALAVFLVGESGRDVFPLRKANESWGEWYDRGGHEKPDQGSVVKMLPEYEGGMPWLEHQNSSGSAAEVKGIGVHRPMASGVDTEDGGGHGTGLVNGLETWNWLNRITDPTPSPLSPDGMQGYHDRWAGQGNIAYEEAALFIRDELESYGLDVRIHRYSFTDTNGATNPEAYNVCGFKEGATVPDEWLVFGAHFDIAPLIAPTAPDLGTPRGYGTFTGAYDNTAGTSMVLSVADAMSELETRRTMVFCFWSGEEGGKRGSNYWTEHYVKEEHPEVTVTNYVNLDMAGVNWPGNMTPSDRVGPTDGGSYPAVKDHWPLRVYIGPDENESEISQPGMVWLSAWIGADALALSQDLAILNGELKQAWADSGQAGVIINEASTARSDHASFQDNLGTVTAGFGGLVDGYDCYHQTCDSLEEMEYWMENDEGAGRENLVDSLDIITWWATMMFLHLDAEPVLNVYL
ncbi:MAG: M20/M25/M40 family metallo-hydrolase [Candidatus Poseidoniaceae archaeon]|nr:M20/M25/M40 family metallo-hydrolase [Candidatus Poseidoniaceae archaeon]